MAEDFTEEQFDDELPEDVEPTKPATPEPKPTPTPTRRLKREASETVEVETPKERYGAFMIPTRIGVIDNETGQPLAEDTEITGLLLGLVTKLLNDVDEIKKSL